MICNIDIVVFDNNVNLSSLHTNNNGKTKKNSKITEIIISSGGIQHFALLQKQ